MDERLRIAQDDDYFRAVGFGAIAFAKLEWDAVWCCEQLQPGYIKTFEPQKKTAGRIGTNLKSLFSGVADMALRSRIKPYADEFCAIVEQRNGLLMGGPEQTTKDTSGCSAITQSGILNW